MGLLLVPGRLMSFGLDAAPRLIHGEDYCRVCPTCKPNPRAHLPAVESSVMITLYTAATPNGHKASIALEELQIPYETVGIELSSKKQKEPWFLDLNPNGRIPVIVDRDNDDFVVFESGAILLYLAEKTNRLIPQDPKQRSRVIQWLMFQMGGIGPMQGQAHVFYRYAPEKIPFAIERYQHETKRLFQVLERRLTGRDYLVDDYSIADIASFPWVRIYPWSGVDIEDLPNVKAWLARIEERPAVQKGLLVPQRLASDEDQAVQAGRNILV